MSRSSPNAATIAVAFSPDGNALIENIGGEVYIYNTHTLAGLLHVIVPTAGNQQVMGFDPADTAILAAATPRAIDLVNVGDGKVSVIPDTVGASWAAFAPDGSLAAVSGGRVRLFPDPLTAPGRSSLISGAGDADRVLFSPAGAMAVIGAGRHALTIYPPADFSAGAVVALSAPGHSGAALGVADAVFGPRGQCAAILTAGKYDLPFGIEIFAPKTYAYEGFIADSSLADAPDDQNIAFAPDGSLAVGDDADIKIYPAGEYRDPGVIAGNTSGQDSGYSWLAFSRSGTLLSADSSVGVSFWDDETEQDLATFSVGSSENTFGEQLAVSPDSKYFAYEITSSYGTGPNDGADVIIVWPVPFLDGDVTDGVRALCAGLGGAPGSSQWHQYISGLPYPGICG